MGAETQEELKERRVRYAWRSTRRGFWKGRMQIIAAGSIALLAALLLQKMFGG